MKGNTDLQKYGEIIRNKVVRKLQKYGNLWKSVCTKNATSQLGNGRQLRRIKQSISINFRISAIFVT